MPMKIKFNCGVCGVASSASAILTREKMFGYGDAFKYLRCDKCGCLQLSERGIDFSKYYPKNYYSLVPKSKKSYLVDWLEKMRNRYAIERKGIFGKIILRFKPHLPLESLGRLKLSFYENILDVGCGDGALLRSLHNLGFKSLTGVDPNISSDKCISDNFRIIKGEISDIEGVYDLIMFHHSLEHIPDQIGTMHAVERLLSPNGRCLIRIPIIDKFAWRQYGVNWAQLDAPRHLFLHTPLSINRLADRSGFRVSSIIFDSNEFQFWGSECISRSIPLVNPTTGLPSPESEKIRNQNLRFWKEKARELNMLHDGDQACIVLERKSDHAGLGSHG